MFQKNILASCLLFLASSNALLLAHTETPEEELTVTYDGVGATTNCKLMYPGHWQVEMATGITRYRTESDWATDWLMNATLVRYGLHSHVELQLEVDHLMSSIPNEETQCGASLIALGTKIKFNHGKNGWPETSLHTQVHFPGSSSAPFLPQRVGGLAHLLMHNDISHWYDLDYVIGADWLGERSTPGLFLGLCNNFPINDRLILMLQSQNLLYDGVWSNDLQAEASYMFNRRVMLDVSSNWNLNDLGQSWDLMATIAVLF